MVLSDYKKLCDAFVGLIHPVIEVVIHNIRSNKICYINGTISGREVGDSSLLDIELLKQNGLESTQYAKLNFNGRLVKSISIAISSEYIICINCDISVFQQMQSLSEHFIECKRSGPTALFKDDWQEQMHTIIYKFLRENLWNFNELKAAQKKAIVHHLFKSEVFKKKKAADYVAKVLGIGRATIFNYLKEWRAK